MEAGEKPENKCMRPKHFWEDQAREWGASPKMLKKICSEAQARKAQAFVDAKRKMRPGHRGAGSNSGDNARAAEKADELGR